MKFEDALNKAYDKIEALDPQLLKDGLLTPEGLLTASVVWNMVAIAMNEKGLDDFVIVRNTRIVSKPLKPVKETDDEKPKIKDESSVNVKEKPEKTKSGKQPTGEK